jgi:hypothetical protein
MRIIGSIPHPQFRVVVYELEKHIYVEMEAGPMKQGFKWPKSKVNGLSAARAIMDEAFYESVRQRFDEMYSEMKRLISDD